VGTMGGGTILEENKAKNDGRAKEKLEPMHVNKGSDGADVLHANFGSPFLSPSRNEL